MVWVKEPVQPDLQGSAAVELRVLRRIMRMPPTSETKRVCSANIFSAHPRKHLGFGSRKNSVQAPARR